MTARFLMGGGFFFIIFAGLAACTEVGAPPGGEPADTPPPQAEPPTAAPAPAPEEPPKSKIFPNTDDGKPIMLIGVNSFSYYNLEEPFLNLLRHSGGWSADTGWPKNDKVEFSALVARGAVNKATLLPTGVPSGYSMMKTGLFRYGARYYPEYFAGTYVFEWEGEAKARCGFGQPTREISFNRIECMYSKENTSWANIEITRIGEDFANPRLYRKEHEKLVKAGELLNPAYKALVSGYKIVRTMDVNDANGSWVRRADQLLPRDAMFWGRGTAFKEDETERALPGGAPLELHFEIANETKTALWMNVPPVLGAPDAFDDPALQKGENKESLKALATEKFPEILASPEWRAYADAVVEAMVASDYPKDHVLFQELANEVWNFANPFWRMTHYYWGIGEALPGASGERFRYGLGYLSAHYAVQFAAALEAAGEADRPWVMVIGSHLANPARTRSALEGYKAYFDERGIDADPFMARTGVAVATYFQPKLFDPKEGLLPADSPEARDAAWLAAIEEDPEGLARKVSDYVIDGPSEHDIADVAKRRQAHQDEAEKFGAFLLGDYEGHDHIGAPGGLSKNPDFVRFMRAWRYGPEGERVTKAWVDALYEQNPDAVIGNYLSIGPTAPAADMPTHLANPWFDFFYGEENGRTKGFGAYMRDGE